MKFRDLIQQTLLQEDLNFLLTNRIPRRAATLFMGRFSKVTNPVVRSISIACWRFFSSVDLSDAAEPRFNSLHDAFIRKLKPGSRPLDLSPKVFCSPCDGIIGEFGQIHAGTLLQAKGFPYSLNELLSDKELAQSYVNGTYLTIRITAGMYHRFHAPVDCHISEVTYISGDTWNVNPIALKRVEKLFCKNERAIIKGTTPLPDGTRQPFLMVPVAAILVASIRLHCIDELFNIRYQGPNHIRCNANYAKGDELGWFEHGSTIILLFPSSYRLHPHLQTGSLVRMGERLLAL